MTTRKLSPAFKTVSLRARRSGALLIALLLGGVTSEWALAFQAGPLLLDAFDFSKNSGDQKKLPRALEEISGLATTSDGRILAHSDERAVIYELDASTGDVVKAFSAGFGGIRGDFEGIAVAEGRLFLVTSTGEILETAEGGDGDVMDYRIHPTNLGRFCEIEGLAFDPGSRSLLLPCKTTRTRELQDHVVVFQVELASMRPRPVPRVFIPFEALEEIDLRGKSFHPSAIEVHGPTGRSVLVAAQEENLLEVSPEGRLLGGKELSRSDHPQPEGITFLPDGSLLLGDEGKGKRGRLTRYPVGGGDPQGGLP